MSSGALVNDISGTQGVQASPRSDRILSALVFVVFAVYGNFGEAILFNPLVTGATVDPVGPIYSAVRTMVTSLGLLVLWATPSARIPTSTGIPRLAPYLCLGAISTLWSTDPSQSGRELLYILLFVLTVGTVVRRAGPMPVLTALLAYMWWSVVMSALFGAFVPAIGQHNAGDFIQGVHAGLWRGIFAHKNTLGDFAAYSFVFFLLFARRVRFNRGRTVVGIVAAAACILMSASATALVAALVGIGSYYFLFRSPLKLTDLILRFGIAAMVASILAGAGPSILAALGRDSTFTGRTDIWEIAVGQFLSRPWFGSGFGMGSESISTALQRAFGAEIADAHSGYLDQLLGLGIVGLCALVGAALLSIASVVRLPQTRNDQRVAYEAAGTAVAMSLCIAITEATPFRVNSAFGLFFFTALVMVPMRRSRPVA